MADAPQLCEASDVLPNEPQCRRLAQWSVPLLENGEPVMLCNFHAEPFEPLPR